MQLISHFFESYFYNAVFIFFAVTKHIIYEPTKPFYLESDDQKIRQIVLWLIGDDIDGKVLNGEHRITDVTRYLEKMEKNSFLRLLQIDELQLIKDYLTEDSWQHLLKFKEEMKFSNVLCNECGEMCSVDTASESFQCQKCLLTFHSFCRKFKRLTSNNVEGFIFCWNCFYFSNSKTTRDCQLVM